MYASSAVPLPSRAIATYCVPVIRLRGGGCCGSKLAEAPAKDEMPSSALPISSPPKALKLDYESRVEMARKEAMAAAARAPEFYVEQESIFKLLENEPDRLARVRLLDSQWILDRAAKLESATSDDERKALALPRRQDMERLYPEAYISIKDLYSLPSNEFTGALPIGAVSHAWLTPEHPDPFGEQLLALAAAIRKAQAGELRRQQPGWHAIPSVKPLLSLPARFALFYDWTSLHQKPRSADEQAAFSEALSYMQLWYVHQKVFALLLTELPPRWASVLGYDARGWPTTERAWTMLSKPNSDRCWPMILEVGSDSGEMPRSPPQHPNRLANILDTKRFTSPKADKPLVIKLYTETAHSIYGGVHELVFPDSGWMAADFEQLSEILPLCNLCGILVLANNHVGDTGMVAISAALQGGALPNLRTLDVFGCQVGSSGFCALFEALRLGATPKLTELNIQRNAADDSSAVALADAITGGAISRMEHLKLHMNRIGDAGGRALAHAISLAGVLPDLKCLGLTKNQLSDETNTVVRAVCNERDVEAQLVLADH